MRISYSKSSMTAIIKLTESDTSCKTLQERMLNSRALSALRLIRDNVGLEVVGSKVIESTSDMIKISCADCSYEEVKIFYDLCKQIPFQLKSKRVIEYSVVEYRIYDNEFTYHIENYLLFNRNISIMAYNLVRETNKSVSYSSSSGITGRLSP